MIRTVSFVIRCTTSTHSLQWIHCWAGDSRSTSQVAWGWIHFQYIFIFGSAIPSSINIYLYMSNIWSNVLCFVCLAVLYWGNLRKCQCDGSYPGERWLLSNHGRACAEPRGCTKHSESHALLRHVRLFRTVRFPCEFHTYTPGEMSDGFTFKCKTNIFTTCNKLRLCIVL